MKIIGRVGSGSKEDERKRDIEFIQGMPWTSGPEVGDSAGSSILRRVNGGREIGC